ncbi:MAG: alpha-hydroxy acid oxidase [Chloroflexota bacterium]
MSLAKKYPSVADMAAGAAKRMPKFVHEYMIGGIMDESCVQRNRSDLNNVKLMPRYLQEAQRPDISTTVLGQTFDAPFGIAPLGLSGLMWPNLEHILARSAKQHNIPYTLSTYACVSLEDIRKSGGNNTWFQYYPSDTPEIEQDLLDRCKNAGYKTLVLTVDIPVETVRYRDAKSGLSVPPDFFDLRTLWQMVTHPAWSLTMLRHGIPQFKTLERYYGPGPKIPASVEFISKHMKGHITAARFKDIRAAWDGNLIVKGVLDVAEAETYMGLEADGIQVSNHGGRQFDAAPTPVEMLPAIREALGPSALILADGGVRNGLDIARMIALGANFVMMGRPFVYAVAAIGSQGGSHVMQILKEELAMTLAQMGCQHLSSLPEHVINLAQRGQ